MTEHTKGERAYFNPSYAHQGEATMQYPTEIKTGRFEDDAFYNFIK